MFSAHRFKIAPAPVMQNQAFSFGFLGSAFSRPIEKRPYSSCLVVIDIEADEAPCKVPRLGSGHDQADTPTVKLASSEELDDASTKFFSGQRRLVSSFSAAHEARNPFSRLAQDTGHFPSTDLDLKTSAASREASFLSYDQYHGSSGDSSDRFRDQPAFSSSTPSRSNYGDQPESSDAAFLAKRPQTPKWITQARDQPRVENNPSSSSTSAGQLEAFKRPRASVQPSQIESSGLNGPSSSCSSSLTTQSREKMLSEQESSKDLLEIIEKKKQKASAFRLDEEEERTDMIEYLKALMGGVSIKDQSDRRLNDKVNAVEQSQAERRKQLEAQRPSIKPLTAEEERLVRQTMVGSSGEVVATRKFATLGAMEMTRGKICCLEGNRWLNDEVINYYMGLLDDRCRSAGKLKVHFFNSFFFQKLTEPAPYNYAAVKRWTKKVSLLDMDKVVVPINHGNTHWSLAVINIRDRRFEYFDSLASSHNRILTTLRRYLIDENNDKAQKKDLGIASWELYSPQEVPQQEDGNSCGVFTCMFALYATADMPFIFSQRTVPTMRRRMVLEIIRNKVDH